MSICGPVNGLLLAFLALVGLSLGATVMAGEVGQRVFVDSAGREVAVPRNIKRVYAAGPPASIILYTLAPEQLIGWNRRPRPAETAFMPERYAQLPVLGRLTGRGNTANVEVVLRAEPDIIFDYGSVRTTYISLANRVQEQIRVPYLLIDGSFGNIPQVYRLLGKLLGKEERAEQLARYAEDTLAQIPRLLRNIPRSKRPRIYYGRRPDGLETGLGGSINVELLELVGATNVAAEGAGRGGLTSVSIEQILKWNPEIVLTLEPRFFRSIFTDPLWTNVEAVQRRRVYLAPNQPFGWFDRPPSVNRLIGVKWLLAVLYPDHVDYDLRLVTREFYRIFYHIDLNDRQLDQLLRRAVGPASE
ncbi:MAG: iron ABC transporter substrate-binding protein [Acidiferrobacterales bacterium]